MRKTKVLAGMTAGLMLLGTAALADILHNDILEADANTVELLVGEAAQVDISIEVESTSDGDGAGCNIAGAGHELVLEVASDDSAVTVSPPQLTFTDCDDIRTVTVTGIAPTGATGANVTFTVDDDATTLRTGTRRTLNEADFVVNVLAPAELEGRDAPAIANAYLHASDDNSDCKELQGTNKNKNNWHGQLISKVAKHFEGQTFVPSQESLVTDYVDTLCGR
jgi:hypothetical protein